MKQNKMLYSYNDNNCSFLIIVNWNNIIYKYCVDVKDHP